ncbi:phosphate acetyltransferase [Balneola sp. MJW-20]|uniref:phosphate acetyltransferase n=1 Tax=Gracilimonas aurantiaca TaxID=3234185 RepID=UPI0034674FB1
MSLFIDQIRERALKADKRIILPRSSDKRVVQAANFMQKNNLCDISLVLEDDTDTQNIDSRIEVLNIDSDPDLSVYIDHLVKRRSHKNLSTEEASVIMSDPLYYAAAKVWSGKAHGAVAGSVSTTADVLRAAIYVIGLDKDTEVVSSVFIMSFDDGKIFTYGDCAVVPYPDSIELSNIAKSSARTHQKLVQSEPRIAMLSFSSKGSAKHERVELVTKALEDVRRTAPDLIIDGELQFDAAYLESVGKRKAPGSPVAGKANVYVFPNLDAGNIGYKITQRLGGATATGPIIQGLDKPMMDLSRGCSWEDIVNTACVCALMS